MTEEGGSLLRQTLMNVDECFVYRVPPLSTSGGHRAENWDLGKPMQTCGFQVERRDNDLYLLFTTENHTKLFALSKCQSNPSRSVESVKDSSRYFVTHIENNTGKSALIGFGFRERDVALDLLGNLQQFQKSIERELQAKNMKVKEIPKLGAGEKIHVNLNDSQKKSTIVAKGDGEKKWSSGAPILLKKPPKFTAEERNIHLSMGDIDLEADHEDHSSSESEGAVARSVVSDFAGGFDDSDDSNGDDDWNDFQEANQPAASS